MSYSTNSSCNNKRRAHDEFTTHIVLAYHARGTGGTIRYHDAVLGAVHHHVAYIADLYMYSHTYIYRYIGTVVSILANWQDRSRCANLRRGALSCSCEVRPYRFTLSCTFQRLEIVLRTGQTGTRSVVRSVMAYGALLMIGCSSNMLKI